MTLNERSVKHHMEGNDIKMKDQTRNKNRREEIISICLAQFIENGLFNTAARDLANALNMQPSGLYYYFKSKDEIVVACAEEAGIRLEDVLILPALGYIDDNGEKEQFVEKATAKMREAVPTMKFFAQVCTTGEYRAAMQPVLERMKERHKGYSVQFAKKLECRPEEVAPYLYACVAIVSNYMIFDESQYFNQPFQLIADAIQAFPLRKSIDKEADA